LSCLFDAEGEVYIILQKSIFKSDMKTIMFNDGSLRRSMTKNTMQTNT